MNGPEIELHEQLILMLFTSDNRYYNFEHYLYQEANCANKNQVDREPPWCGRKSTGTGQ